MNEHREKPGVIEARRFDGSWASAKPILDWMDPDWSLELSKPRWGDFNGGQMYIPTPEGELIARAGNWIIKRPKVEFYPSATYEPAR